ncbi:MAG: SIS domain-containing protein [Candidatus Bipolaricaulaceae bacterium]
MRDYLQQVSELMLRLPAEQMNALVDLLDGARAQGQCVFVFGNGGSAATAAHFACDLGKGTAKPGRPRFRVVTLHDLPTLSAYANDCGYQTVFAEPLRALGRPGDVALAVSASGNSENVLAGVGVARQLGLHTVGLTGFNGGRLKQVTDLCLVVPCDDMQQIEDAHLVILHAVFRALL